MKCAYNDTYIKCAYCGYEKEPTTRPLKIIGKPSVHMCKDCVIQQLLWATTNHHVVTISNGTISIDKMSAVDWIRYFSNRLHFALVPGQQFDLALKKLDDVLAALDGGGPDNQVVADEIKTILKCFRGGTSDGKTDDSAADSGVTEDK